MKRRDLIKYTALMTGAAISAPLLFSLESCKADPAAVVDNAKPIFFNEDNMRLVKSIVDTVLPKTDSPAASEVGVHHTIDQMVGSVYKEEDKNSYRTKFAKLSSYLQKEAKGKGFHQLEEEERLKILRSLANSDIDAFSDAKEGYQALKQQTIAYYLNTEEISTNYLNYLPVPGQYEGCITLESVGGKAWAI